jgi:hypothetical protein
MYLPLYIFPSLNLPLIMVRFMATYSPDLSLFPVSALFFPTCPLKYWHLYTEVHCVKCHCNQPSYFSNKTETVRLSLELDITVYFLYVFIFSATYHDYTFFQTDYKFDIFNLLCCC